MVDAATKSKRIQDNQKVKDAREHGLLTSKKFEVVLSKANNEPLLTLDLLHQLVGSLASAFTSGSDNVFNPNQSVIKIIDGSRVINKRELKFNLYGLKEDDVKNPKFGEDYVSLTLYPEDVIVIVDYIRRWLVQPQCYKKELGGVSWGISASTLIDSWKTAVKRGKKDPGRKSNYIADFSLKQLKGAVDELFKQINTIYAKKTKEVKYDSIDDLLREIEQKFTEDPAGVWEKIGLVTALGIAEGAIGAQVILISNKNLRVGDARQIINAFYTQVATQLKPQEPQKPWNRILATTKEKFTSTAYLTDNENIITMSDITKVSRFIDLFNQLLKELAIEPKEVEKKIVRDETKQDEGGDTALDEPQLLNNEKIIEKVTRNLIYESGKDFLAFFANKEIDPSQLDPKQRDWLLVGLPSFISSLLEDKYTQGQLTELIQDQISKSLTQLSQEKSDFTVTSNQLADIQKLVNEQFFKQNTGDFFKWIGAVPTAVDIEKSREKIKDKTAQAIVPPGLIDVTTPGYQTPAEIVAGLSTKRKKFYQETAIGLLGLYFSSDQTIAGFTLEDILRLHPELYDFILAFVIKELAGIPTDQLISNLRYQLFQKLVLTHEFQAQIDQLLVTKLTRQPRSFEKILIAMSRESIDEGDA
ncbi:hypothetical protein KJ628_01505, partial [Patescibacteria group bacterium]|nr:hypothetical protein [Patescibacteria group bacterium]